MLHCWKSHVAAHIFVSVLKVQIEDIAKEDQMNFEDARVYTYLSVMFITQFIYLISRNDVYTGELYILFPT